jgi:trehalose 6-phosphate synthase/phosphatase
MSPPIAVTSVLKPEEAAKLKDVEISLNPDAVFSTAVGPPAKKTLARWHVEQPEEIVDAMEALLK